MDRDMIPYWRYRRRKLLTGLAVWSFFALLFCTGYAFFSSKFDMLMREDADIIVSSADMRRDPEEERAIEEAAAQHPEAESIEAVGDVYTDTGVVNILLIGTDERCEYLSTFARGDCCMLMSLDKSTMKAHLVSFERGMGVPILEGEYKGQYDWLTHTFEYGNAPLMMREIRECFKVDVDKYVRVNFYTFEQVINCIGGVDIELSEQEALALNGVVNSNAVAHTKVHAGLNHLDGFDALQYARQRYIDNDWHRIKRQRNVIEAVVSKTKSLSITELDSLIDTVLPLIQTNLTEGDIAMLMLLLPRYSQVSIEQMTIPAEGTYGSMKGMDGRSMFAVDFGANAAILQEALYGQEG